VTLQIRWMRTCYESSIHYESLASIRRLLDIATRSG
jgi:hypothetical protein